MIRHIGADEYAAVMGSLVISVDIGLTRLALIINELCLHQSVLKDAMTSISNIAGIIKLCS